MSAFDKHRDAARDARDDDGRARGRLAVALDLLTDALAMVGQHGVYCQSARMPGRPTMDIALVLEQIGDAKELVQSVIESEASMSGSPAPIGVVAHYNLLEQLEPSGPGELYRARDTKAGRTVAVRLLPADFTARPPPR